VGRPPAADLLAAAREAAHAGGDVLRERFGGRQRAVASKSSPTDVVGEADLAAESAIRAVLAARRPHDAILAEESGASGEGALRWVVDPLDGTVNYLYGFPQYAVSIAVEDAEGTIAGVVLDVEHDEEWAATCEGPATLGGEPIRGSDRDDLSRALVATGFGYDAAVRAAQGEAVARLLPRVRDVRRADLLPRGPRGAPAAGQTAPGNRDLGRPRGADRRAGRAGRRLVS
jgi:myo-inositol-1(or 4)-monophosphatase